ncbi:MAG TPA: nitrilase-related carbon-nitrogen hydrolase [Steroidobacteraceae bacterium]
MESVRNDKHLVEACLAILATTVLVYFGNGLEPLWPLMWFATLPILWFSLRSNSWTAAAAAIVAMLLGSLNLWSYFTQTLSLPGVAWAGLFLTASIAFAAAVVLFRALVLRGAVWSALLAPPALWVTYEYLRNVTSPHGSAGSLAYSQLKFLPVLQLASITGPWGISFLLLLFSTALALGLYSQRTSPKLALRVVGAGAGAVAAALVFGAVRLAIPQNQMVKVGLLASDEKGNGEVTSPGPDTERLFGDYARQADVLAQNGAQVIVMPEKLGVTLEGQASATDAILQSVATRAHTTVIAGVVHVDPPAKYNEARIYVPGSGIQRYDKEHMLPPFESNLTPGSALVLLPRGRQTWGVAICKDMDFASPARRYGEAGTGLLLVPGWDFAVDASWHGHIAIMRGVEDGFSIARAAKGGFLTVSDNRGHVLAEVSSGSAPFAALLVDVPTEHSATIYEYLGDWFAWVAIGLVVFAVVQLARQRGAS